MLMALLAEIVSACKVNPYGLNGKHAFLEKNVAWHVRFAFFFYASQVERVRVGCAWHLNYPLYLFCGLNRC